LYVGSVSACRGLEDLRGVFPLREWFADLREHAVSETSRNLLVRKTKCARVSGESERLWSREVCVFIDFWLQGGAVDGLSLVAASE
jgi:hypothetical protein